MRPPLRVEAKVAEELRNWLTSELERLDAANTNPFAHHVVTILLQEDLDIDDEPLSTDDCFDQWGIRSVRRSRTRDKQIKAAVHFLRSAIASEESIPESEIEIIVNELVIRIEATKQKLSRKKSRGRDLLGTLTVNTENTTQDCVGADHKEVERSYNEVFPSLPGEPQTKAHSTSFVSPTNSVWNKSPRGKENNHQTRLRRFSQSVVKKVRFADRDEAEAFGIAAHVFAMSMSDKRLPNPEAMEIPRSLSLRTTHHAHLFHPDPFDSCWKSAFYAFKSTSKPFVPSAEIPASFIDIKAEGQLLQLKPIINIQSNGTASMGASKLDLSKFVNLLDPENPKMFTPVDVIFPSPNPSLDFANLNKVNADDLEVINIFHTGKVEQERKRATQRPQPQPENHETADLQGTLAFPDHFGRYWNNLVDRGAMCMYPDLGSGLPPNQPDGHPDRHPRDSPGQHQLGAVGCAVPYNGPDDNTSSTRAWASVTFTNDLYSFAVGKLGDLRLRHKASDEEVGAACATGTSDNEESEDRNEVFSAACGALPDLQSRGIIASSDSGILLQAGNERGSLSPFSEPSLSAPAAFQLSDSGWPLERTGASAREEDHADLWNGLCLEEAPLEPEAAACARLDFRFSARRDSLIWPEPPRVLEDPMPDDEVQAQDDYAPSLRSGFRASEPWPSPPRQTSWDNIQRDVFPSRGATSDFTLPYSELTSSPGLFHPTYIGNFLSSTLWPQPPSPAQPFSSERLPLAPLSTPSHQNSVVMPDGPSLWPSLPPPGHHNHHQMISESQSAGYFPAPNATQFMPSQLSSDAEMESTVAHALQSAYVNSIFNNSPPESSIDLQSPPNAVNCDDLERSWFTSADEGFSQNNATRPAFDSVVRGRTCSKWLENNCDLGSACPFSHPSL